MQIKISAIKVVSCILSTVERYGLLRSKIFFLLRIFVSGVIVNFTVLPVIRSLTLLREQTCFVYSLVINLFLQRVRETKGTGNLQFNKTITANLEIIKTFKSCLQCLRIFSAHYQEFTILLSLISSFQLRNNLFTLRV